MPDTVPTIHPVKLALDRIRAAVAEVERHDEALDELRANLETVRACGRNSLECHVALPNGGTTVVMVTPGHVADSLRKRIDQADEMWRHTFAALREECDRLLVLLTPQPQPVVPPLVTCEACPHRLNCRHDGKCARP